MTKQLISETLYVYNWSDIQTYMCEYLGITQDQFYSYHSVVGGEYKNLWHVALETIVPNRMHNDTIVEMFYSGYESYTGEEDWKNDLLRAWNAVCRELYLKPEDSIWVKFSW